MVALEHSTTGDAEFHIWTVRSDDAVTVHVFGDLDMGTGPQLMAHVAQHRDASDVAIDLTACCFIDSSGITALLTSRQQLGPASTMRLVGVAPAITRTLQICGVLAVFDIGAR